MCFILNHSINYGVTFSSGFPSLEMKLFTYCKTSSWCFGKSLDKNQLYTKSEQFFYTIPEKMNLASYKKSSDHSEEEVNVKSIILELHKTTSRRKCVHDIST